MPDYLQSCRNSIPEITADKQLHVFVPRRLRVIKSRQLLQHFNLQQLQRS